MPNLGRWASVLAPAGAALLLVSLLPEASAGAARTRPSTAGHVSGSGVSYARGHASGSSVSYARGHARYGYGGGRYRGYYGGYWGHRSYWGWGGYYGSWFGPYWGYWYPPTGPYSLVARIPQNSPGVIETDVRPKKAEIWIDGTLLGQARDYNGKWDRLWIEPGKHEVEFRKDGYQSLRMFVDLPAAGYVKITETLQEGEGLDPRSMERPPPPRVAVERSPPPAPRADAGAPSALRRGLMKFAILPADAAVYLDGEFLAHGDELARLHGAIPVAGGVHRIEVVRPGFDAVSREVVVEEGDPVRVEIELQREEGGD